MPNDFDNLISAGMTQSRSSSVAGDAFTLSGQAGTFYGVFRGDQSSVDFMESGGHDSSITNAVSVLAADLASAPTENEILTTGGVQYVITSVSDADNSTYDIELRKLGHGE